MAVAYDRDDPLEDPLEDVADAPSSPPPTDHCVMCRCLYGRDDGRIDDFVGAGGVAFPDPDPIGPSLDANKVGGGSPLAPG